MASAPAPSTARPGEKRADLPFRRGTYKEKRNSRNDSVANRLVAQAPLPEQNPDEANQLGSVSGKQESTART